MAFWVQACIHYLLRRICIKNMLNSEKCTYFFVANSFKEALCIISNPIEAKYFIIHQFRVIKDLLLRNTMTASDIQIKDVVNVGCLAHRTRYFILILGSLCISLISSNMITFNFTKICMVYDNETDTVRNLYLHENWIDTMGNWFV